MTNATLSIMAWDSSMRRKLLRLCKWQGSAPTNEVELLIISLRMPIDVHAHSVPPSVLETIRGRGGDYGVELTSAPACAECLRFAYGLQVRPFFPRLLENPARRAETMARIGITRQVLSIWADVFGYGLPSREGTAWHRLLNRSLGEWCGK